MRSENEKSPKEVFADVKGPAIDLEENFGGKNGDGRELISLVRELYGEDSTEVSLSGEKSYRHAPGFEEVKIGNLDQYPPEHTKKDWHEIKSWNLDLPDKAENFGLGRNTFSEFGLMYKSLSTIECEKYRVFISDVESIEE